MTKINAQRKARENRHRRIRSRVTGTAEKPRLSVYRSNKAIYVQLIDDINGVTLAAVDSRKLTGQSKLDQAAEVGTKIAELAKKASINTVVFDRGGFQYHGAVKAVAENARTGGLVF